MARYIFYALTAFAVFNSFYNGGENPHLVLQYALLAIPLAFASGWWWAQPKR